MGSIGNNTSTSTSVNFPINGYFTTKRGKEYKYTLYKDGDVEMFETKVVSAKRNGKSVGGSKTKDFMVTATQELKNYLKEKYSMGVH